jgi:hypothetical protein
MSEASKQLAKAIRDSYHPFVPFAVFDDQIVNALDAYAEHIASRVMAHLRGEAGLDVDQALKQFTGSLEQDIRSGWKHNVNDTEPKHD